jgi:hypothetical protein
MKDTQQHLIIEDLDYCNTVSNETEEIVGGITLWKAFTDTVEAKVDARVTTFKDLFKGKLPTGQTANDLIEPGWFGTLRRWKPF